MFMWVIAYINIHVSSLSIHSMFHVADNTNQRIKNTNTKLNTIIFSFDHSSTFGMGIVDSSPGMWFVLSFQIP